MKQASQSHRFHRLDASTTQPSAAGTPRRTVARSATIRGGAFSAFVAWLMLLLVGTSGAWAARITVDSTAWGADNDAATCTLWEAIETAIAAADTGGCTWANESKIDLAADTTYITQGQLPRITTSVDIWGNGATLRRDQSSPQARFFDVTGSTTTLKLVDMTLTGGSANYGGALRVRGLAELRATRVTLVGNNANMDGGAIHNRGKLSLDFATLADNTAVNGAGIFANRGTITMWNSILSENLASTAGGGIAAVPGMKQLTIKNTTFFANEAAQGGAIYRSGLPTPSSDSVSQTTFKANRVTQLGDGGTFYLAAPTDVTIGKSALWEDDSESALCAGDLEGLTSAGHNASTDASCGLDHADDHPGVSFTLSDLVDHGGFTEVVVPLCDAGPDDPYACSPLIDQYPCGGVSQGEDQRGANRDTISGNPNDPTNLCDIGAYESMCEFGKVSGSTLSHLIYLDQYKNDGSILNNGACATSSAEFETTPTQGCTIRWQFYGGPWLEMRRVWFLDPNVQCAYDCFDDPTACKRHCTLDPDDWKAALPGLGFEVPAWDVSPHSTSVSLVSPTCDVPSVRYIMEFADQDGVDVDWDPEVQITSGDSSGSSSGQGTTN